jgi:predicted DCC family thiol-disulfide oxidoreductase YuxK
MTAALCAACERSVHVLPASGGCLRAGRACLFVLERLGWGWLARLLAVPPFVWVIEIAYRLVADHRRVFSRIMFRRE